MFLEEGGAEGAEGGGGGGGLEMTDMTDSKVLAVRRTIYLTIMSRSGDSPIIRNM